MVVVTMGISLWNTDKWARFQLEYGILLHYQGRQEGNFVSRNI